MPFDGEKLRALRIRRGYSQQDLADKAKVTPRTVRDAESGKRTLHGYNQLKIAQALDCALQELQSDDSPRQRTPQNQLPASPRRLVGRDADLERLTTLMRESGGRVVIEGPSGVGKTTLALVFASDARDQYPDGIIFVDLQGGGDPLEASRAMRHVMWSVQAAVSVDGHLEVQGTYRAQLREKHLLLVLDNASDAAQIEPLIPPAPSAVIVTSRRSLPSLDLDSLVLDPLDRSASVDLLQSFGCSVKHAASLAEMCGDLPLVLSVVGREASRSDCDVSELVQALEGERSRVPALDALDPMAGIAASLQRGIASLSPSLRRALAELGVFPQELDRAAAARVWNVEPRQALAMLRELKMRHLVQHCTGRGEDACYRVHDLVRVAAAEHVAESEVAEARLRHAQHYLALLQPPPARRSKHIDDTDQIVSRIHADSANLYAALDWCTRRAPHQEAAAALLAGVHRTWGLNLVLDLASGTDETEDVLEESQRPRMVHLYLNLGNLCRKEGDYETAIRAFGAAVREAPRHGNPHLAILARSLLALAYVQQGFRDRAVATIRPYMRLAKKQRNTVWESLALMILGYAFRPVSDRRSAALFKAALKAGAPQPQPLIHAEVKGALASCLARLGEPHSAYALACEALEEVRKVGPVLSVSSREAPALTVLAMICLPLDIEIAARYADEALEVTERGAPGHERARALQVRAEVALASASWVDAAPCVEEMLKIDATLQAYSTRPEVRQLGAAFMARSQRFDDAIALLESVIVASPEGPIGAWQDGLIRLDLAELLMSLGHKDAAWDQAVLIRQRVSCARLDRRLVDRVRALSR